MRNWVIAILFLFSIYWHVREWNARQQGWYDGNRYADRVCEERIGQEVDDRVSGFRRVQGLREKSEYERGKESCHE